MGYTFSEIIDVEAVQELMTSLWEASGIPVGIIDLDGNILIATGWQRICTDYHRGHPETEALCRESDRYIEEHLHAGELPECGYVEYRCKNGMIDIGVPIVIEDRHLATLFLGQFFYEPPDEEHFREQAGRHGFDEDQYLEHLREVPIFSREKVKAILNYHTRFVNMLTGMGVQKLRQVRVQQELEKSEEKYRTLYNKTPVMLHTIDSRGRLLSVSDYWLETLGYERSEVLGRKAMEFLTEESRRYAEEVALPQFLKTGSVKNVAYQFVKKNDEVMDVLLSAVAERNEKGEIVRGLAVTTDITESKRAEETLRDSERRFRTLVEAIPHGIQECDTEGIITLTNRGYDRMFGYEPGEAVGEAIWEKEVGEGKDALRKYLADLVREEPEPVPYFTRNSTRDGRLIDLQVDWNYKRDEAGTLLGFTSIITDITERKAAKDALRESERRLSTLMGNLPGMAYRCRNDRDWAMEFVSEGCRALVGYASEDLVGNRTLAYNDLIHPDDRVDVWEKIQAALEKKQPFQIEYRLRTAGGETRWVWEQGQGVFTEAGELLALEGFISDVSDRKEAKEQIESLARFPKENTNPVLRVSAEGTLLFANKGGMALLPFLGKGLGEPVNENWRERLGEALALDRARECEEQFGERWYSLSLVPVSEGGYINLYGRDVTKRHRAEEALRHSEEQVRLLLDSTAEAIYGLDPAGNCTFVNPSCLRMLGYADESELLGKNMHDLIHHHRIDGSLYPKEECQVYLAFKEGRGVHTDAEVLWRSDGTNFPVEYWSYPILKDGEGIGSVVTFIDITERKQAEMTMRFALQEAEVSREKIAAILKSVTDGLIVTDLNRRVVLMNRAAEKFLGTTLGEAFSRPVQDLIPAKGVAEEVLGILRGQVPGEGQEWEQSDAASDRAWMIQARSSGVKGAGGNISGAITTLRDVTREREIDQMKNEFISTAAHELRTPLTSVLGYTELLLNPEEYGISGEEQRREYLNYVYDKAQALGGIIEDLLDLSRVQAGKVLSLSPGPCEIGALLGKVVDPYRKLSSRHRFELVLPEEPVTLVADQKKLEQVLDNLISNAVKFSPDGGEIRVKGQVLKGRYQVTVRDEGIGMTSEGVARVFDKFYRVDASTTAVAGLGLGMAIAKSIIDAHGGTIRVESEPGKGTKVTFSLPLA